MKPSTLQQHFRGINMHINDDYVEYDYCYDLWIILTITFTGFLSA